MPATPQLGPSAAPQPSPRSSSCSRWPSGDFAESPTASARPCPNSIAAEAWRTRLQGLSRRAGAISHKRHLFPWAQRHAWSRTRRWLRERQGLRERRRLVCAVGVATQSQSKLAQHQRRACGRLTALHADGTYCRERARWTLWREQGWCRMSPWSEVAGPVAALVPRS